ncbi:VCBS repeat-containing protein [Catalinimonas niigatensis]|uniref:VCBS repeat-containing protein n=1 Tax=Catalinimonas niigatensis TaxID=1397264 RepID=UPI0026651233|nr:VCBS repeat-containing protein [Catalinimonas niigatensis]WPP48414.1 VCBS repeat-containing protein [Catalinimonas niigatensis]
MNTKAIQKRILPFLFLIVSAACGGGSDSEQLFELLPASYTGVDFQNTLTETPQMNIFTYLYFYNGGGVAAGDLNGDGLPDLYFTSNLENNRLYLNKGDFKFQDITESTKVEGQGGWTTGVTMADVNGDGRLDIYVSQLGDYQNIRGKNQLYINMGNDSEGIPTFEEKAAEYGLDLKGFSTQAAFFDYDLDGDLDMYMLNHSVHSNGTFGKSTLRKETHPLAGDKLLRNDNGKFTDVTESSGIYSSALGYGLGITIGDVNWDGYPDIYIGNDFHENDYLYINKGDGTFSEKLEDYIRHTSRFSMGNDIGDINNDGLPDLVSLDMQPSDPVKLKTSAGEDSYDVYNYKLKYGYNHQFARNTLQLNMGKGHFSEIGLLTGTSATDWSWSGLMADLNLDGNKDLYIANGIKRRSNDLDYINYISNDALQHRLEGDLSSEDMALVEKMPIVKIPNVVFQNKGGLTFENMSNEWGLGHESFSNGAVYADLDNDGDLDLVTNNIDQEAFIYKNRTIDLTKEAEKPHYLKLAFNGKAPNTKGIGARIIIPLDSQTIIQEVYATRGYQSSVPTDIIVGLGEREKIDSLIVVWPDHQYEVLRDVVADTTLVLEQVNAQGKYDFSKSQSTYFEDVSDSLKIGYKHEENTFIEFNREALVPHMSSTEGPKMAVGDINGDQKEDFFIGGAKWQPGAVYVQTEESFQKLQQTALEADSLAEDVGAELIDVDGDGDLDLIVVSGGNEFQGEEEALLLRLYRNDGEGNFTRDRKAIPQVYVNGSTVIHADYDQDGDEDLFVGGRVVSRNYGKVPQSYLLENDGKGNFTDITEEVGPALSKIGMVKDAAWTDVDGDGYTDLIVVGEWMPVTIFKNEKGVLRHAEIASLAQTHGWWNTIEVADIDQDGDPDLICGNLGLNSRLKSSPDEPVKLYIKDIDQNGSVEQLMTHYIQGKEYLFATKEELSSQLNEIKSRFVRYEDFANAKVNEIFPDNMLESAEVRYAYEFRSGIFINEGDMNFRFQPFPVQGQFTPLQALLVSDFDQDGAVDVLAAGNFYEVTIERGRYDADYGTLMMNEKGQGELKWIPNHQSGIYINGQVRDLKRIQYQGRTIIAIAKNKDSIQFIEQNAKPTQLHENPISSLAGTDY